ncbi:23604_t:CDS:2 [Dentiscutata erythropus]|uniref:23604_t:CDS:1 n=1 Tax=Dentiscutata erythropus TaxID=1348616 RepID=A0A9N9NQN5_9GLOM|nr:23604_t:CDS:2 [Dentiscutata erythropus]
MRTSNTSLNSSQTKFNLRTPKVSELSKQMVSSTTKVSEQSKQSISGSPNISEQSKKSVSGPPKVSEQSKRLNFKTPKSLKQLKQPNSKLPVSLVSPIVKPPFNIEPFEGTLPSPPEVVISHPPSDFSVQDEHNLEESLNEQKDKISEILTKLEKPDVVFSSVEIEKSKVKKSYKKMNDEFYQDAIKRLLYELFHEHKQINENELKSRLKTKLEDDDFCNKQLQKLKNKEISFIQLWHKKFYSAHIIDNDKSGARDETSDHLSPLSNINNNSSDDNLYTD